MWMLTLDQSLLYIQVKQNLDLHQSTCLLLSMQILGQGFYIVGLGHLEFDQVSLTLSLDFLNACTRLCSQTFQPCLEPATSFTVAVTIGTLAYFNPI